MFKALRPLFVPLRRLSRAGFTLVELLVVIGIIAILAGVALGPITNALKKAKQNAGLQTSRTLALAEFQYANDNSQVYPDLSTPNNGGGAGAVGVANCLVNGGYISDPGIFYIGGSSEGKYTGSTTSLSLSTTNISWDFAGSSGTGLSFNAPDTLPLVWSSLNSGTSVSGPTLTAPGVATVTLGTTSSTPFGTAGVALCYKSNSASFIVSTVSGGSYAVAMTSASFPGQAGVTINKGGG